MISVKIGLCLSAAALFLGPVPVGSSQTSQQLREQDRQWESAHRQHEAMLDGDTPTPVLRASMALPVDTDNDGMPDTWENDHGFNPNDPKDAWFDRDTDLVVNLFEYQLGSDPDNPSSPPTVTVAPSGADYLTLTTALNSVAPGTAIRVAGGTYNVTYTTFNEKVVMIQGGWNPQFNRRDLDIYPTILDGQLQDEILYFSQSSGQPVIILDGLHFIRGAGNFGAVNLLAKGTASLKASIFNCSFSDSTASSYGAALSMHSWDASESDRTIANTLIAENLASGIYSQNTFGAKARWRITNSTISGNTNGGGDNGYGIDAFTMDTGVLDVAIFNSVIRGNTGRDIIISRTIAVSADYSDMGMVETKYGATYKAGPNLINVDPGFRGEGDYRLREDSPCRNTALNQRAPVCDLDGQPRPYPAGGSADIGCYEYWPEISIIDSGDYNGDGTSDIAVFRGSAGMWSVRNLTRIYLGSWTDNLVPGDYNGDGTTDIAIFRQSSGMWSVRNLTRFYLGGTNDQPIPGDYNGNGTAEAGIFRGSSGMWSIRDLTRAYWGSTGDTVIPGYYDADTSKDIAIFRGSSGMWSVRNITRFYFGAATDDLAPGDYNGTGKWEGGIFRESSGLWSIRNVTRMYLGSTNDWPLPADYNGDGMDDAGIFRDSAGMWSVRNLTRLYFGSTNDIPVTR